jgi:2-dehydropantoate 2-reductase
VLFCVKTRDTADAARALAPLLRAEAVLVSLQNGVDNVPKLRDAGIDALAAVVYVATSMPAPGHLLHAGRGDLVIGEYGARPDFARDDRAPGQVAATQVAATQVAANQVAANQAAAAAQPSARARKVAAWFERAGVPSRLEDDVRGELWTKLVMNCAFNAISALGRSRYGAMLDDPDVRVLMREAIGECVAVAQADGVTIAGVDTLCEAAMRLGEAMREASSSTAQDLARGRPTEIDSLNGYVAQRGQALGIAAPLNRTLTTLVRLLERAATT